MRRALIIGIDEYRSAPLQGCVNDANRLEQVLSRHHDNRLNFDCELLTSPPKNITRGILRRAISNLFLHSAEVAFLHFSGHGTISGLGGYLVTPDAEEFDVGVSMTEILGMANDSPVAEIFITLDCCHSGAFGVVPQLSNEKAILAEGVSVITASRAGQESVEEGGGGLFTTLLVEALEGGAAGILGDVTAAGIYAYVDNALGAWDQRPLFKSNVSKFIRIRDAAPKIDLGILQKLEQIFPLPAEDFQLGPEYEPEVEPHDSDKELLFQNLIKLRHAGLVEPIGEEHMYHAAMNSKCCRLTNLGRYYWRLVHEKKI